MIELERCDAADFLDSDRPPEKKRRCKGDWVMIWLPAPEHGAYTYVGRMACAVHAEVQDHRLFMTRMRLRGDGPALMAQHDKGSNPDNTLF